METILNKLIVGIITLVVTMGVLLRVQVAHAADVAKVSITFDDGFLSTYTNARPILSARNLPATLYLTSGFVEDGVTDDGFPAMTWAQAQSLQNDYGWELAAHTHTHAELPTLTTAQVIAQITDSNAAYAAHGLNVTNFASPYGAYDNAVLVELLKSYNSHRGFADVAYNTTYPANKAVLQVQQVNSDTTVAQVKGYIDQAIANKTWLILVLHDVQTSHNPDYEYVTTKSDLTAIANYIVTKGIKVERVDTALAKSGGTVIGNYNFANGMTNWTTDNSTQVTVDTNNNGAYGDSQNAAKLTGSQTAAHLFSSLIQATPGVTYSFESFYNTLGLTAGELGFYIDEYDTLGNWISGKWLGRVANNAVGYFTNLYTTTSGLVNTLRLQTYLTAGSTGTAYVDNVDLHDPNAAGSPTPIPTGTITPSVTPTGSPAPLPANNLVQNPSFENATSDWADNWARSSTNTYTLDTATNGDNGVNSVHVTSSGTSSHLFSDLISVTQDTHTWRTYVKAGSLTGEFGFYIDEYDVNGTWISGQWKGAIYNPFTQVASFTYVPTSANVAKVGLQYYLVGGATADIYVDSVSLAGTIVATGTPSLTPSVTPTPTGAISEAPTPTLTGTPSLTPSPTPVAANIVQNPSFENVSGSFAADWATNDAAVYALDTASNGNAGANAVRVSNSSASKHLFSALIPVEQAAYSWKTYINALSLLGEFGFYIDEYDAAGNWISGQWKGAIYGPFVQVATFAYTPTSANVSKVGLQYYVTGGTNTNLFLDSVSLSK